MTEPTTNGKVILKTTLGDLELELWSKEVPKACRNFIQLCLEKYYDGCIFHRVVKNAIVQTGDPTGTGEGGESIYEEPFKDEYHSRLRFNRRGMVGMSSSAPDSNQSQFFITLDSADSLTRKHTLFAKIVGDTLFNILKVNEIEVDENERPLFPPKIISTDVVYNPFDDIVPRQIKQQQTTSKEKQKKKIIPKNLGLLSFGDEELDDDNDKLENKPINKPKTNNLQSTSLKTNNNTTTTTTTTTNTNNTTNISKSKEDLENKENKLKPTDSNTFEQRMRESIIQKNNKLNKENIEKRQSDEDDKEEGEENENKNAEVKEKDIEKEEKIVTESKNQHKDIPKKKKVVGSLSFKKTTKRESDLQIAPPRIKKQQQESDILNKLNKFKSSLSTQPTNEDDDWKGHKLKFGVMENQEHYM